MDRAELYEYLRDNLRIELSLNTDPDYGEDGTRYLKSKVTLTINGVVIAKAEDFCSLEER